MPDNPMDVIRMALDREKAAYRNYTEYARIATQPEIRSCSTTSPRRRRST